MPRIATNSGEMWPDENNVKRVCVTHVVRRFLVPPTLSTPPLHGGGGTIFFPAVGRSTVRVGREHQLIMLDRGHVCVDWPWGVWLVEVGTGQCGWQRADARFPKLMEPYLSRGVGPCIAR